MSPIAREVLQTKLNEALALPIRTSLTARDVRLPQLPGKAMAVIGVRRGGKTSFLQRRVAERVAEGHSPDSQLLLSLEDERLTGMTAGDLGWLLEEYERRTGGRSPDSGWSLYLDEVQLVEGWQKLVRRLLDAGGIEVFVSGSSAKLLSREVATSLRGRGMEVLIHPFSFREALRHASAEPGGSWSRLKPGERAALDAALRTYLEVGGFPEAQQAEPRDRLTLLKGYIDVMLLRDVIERHNVSNTQALRWLQRHLLSTPGGGFSVKKLYDSLRSQGIPVAKDTLYEYLDHLEDAFLIRTISMHSTSERQRMVNPRKVYPIDPGLIPIYERTGREHRGRALETTILLELERREYTVDWVRVDPDWEVDFFAARTGDTPLLINVCMDTADPATWEREVRSLEAAAAAHPEARALLITLDSSLPAYRVPATIEWQSAAQWLLATE